MTHFIRVLGKKITISAYIHWIQLAKANRSSRFAKTLTSEFGGTGEEILREFRKGVHDRINRHLPERGARDFESSEVWRFRMLLNSRSILRKSDIPSCLQRYLSKFEHRLYTDEML